MAAAAFEQILAQLMGVGQVAVVGQRNAERRVDVERLGLRGARAAGRRVTHMANAHVALQALHMARLKHILHQAVGFTQTEPVVGVNGDDACGILATVLKHRQRIINRLVYRHETGDTDNTAHVVFSSSALPPRQLGRQETRRALQVVKEPPDDVTELGNELRLFPVGAL